MLYLPLNIAPAPIRIRRACYRITSGDDMSYILPDFGPVPGITKDGLPPSINLTDELTSMEVDDGSLRYRPTDPISRKRWSQLGSQARYKGAFLDWQYGHTHENQHRPKALAKELDPDYQRITYSWTTELVVEGGGRADPTSVTGRFGREEATSIHNASNDPQSRWTLEGNETCRTATKSLGTHTFKDTRGESHRLAVSIRCTRQYLDWAPAPGAATAGR